jgi:REP element-mobilizing transposase RayT
MATYTNLLYHLVFSTKDRLPLIEPRIRERLHDYLGGAVRGNGGTPYQIGGTADNVHLLLRWVPNGELSDLLREIKSGSTKWVHEHFKTLRHFHWQNGYGAFSVSQSQSNRVAAYIRNQEEHHRKRTFKQEFVSYLRANGIAYDERYIWE